MKPHPPAHGKSRPCRALRTMLCAGALLVLAAPGALASSASVQDGKGNATARLMFKIVIPRIVIVAKDGTVSTNDGHRLMPTTSVTKVLRSDPHAVVALP